MLLDKGRVVIITRGADAGKKGVVIGIDGNFVMVKVGNKERKISIRHVEPTSKVE